MGTIALDPAASAVIAVDSLSGRCRIEGCGGSIVRHSLGAGQSVHRCTRCFRRYQLAASAPARPESRLRRFLREFTSWRDE